MYVHTGSRHSTSVKLQTEAVDLYMKLCRYREEEQQLLCEIISFLSYFKEVVLTGLSSSLTGMYFICITLCDLLLHYLETIALHVSDNVIQEQTLV